MQLFHVLIKRDSNYTQCILICFCGCVVLPSNVVSTLNLVTDYWVLLCLQFITMFELYINMIN